MLTPEGRVKKAVTAFLNKQECCWFAMPVVSGYGKPLLDYIGCSHGRFFAIEAKAPGKKLTSRQRWTADQITIAGGHVFIISGPNPEGEHDFLQEWFSNPKAGRWDPQNLCWEVR